VRKMDLVSSHSRFGLAILAALCACAAPSLTLAQTAPTAPPASPSPAASSAPEAPSDPCDSLSNLVSRPSFTTSACAVKRDQVLLEAGYSNLSASGPGAVTLVNVPQGLFRMGVGHNIELDVAPPSLERQSGMPPIGGNSDAQFGLKYEFGYSPKVTSGMNVVYTAASGTAPFTGNGPGLLVNLNGALTLSPAVGLFGSLGYNSQGGDGCGSAALRRLRSLARRRHLASTEFELLR